ncbi:MAG: PhzF family phenazine biosynthesis protein [Lachnospiraceae bacterium]|nr:PhzF family phenazine biosynthesis protein [Lachnospiraceae bacterium]MEE3461803.1 PhzF family phenazine biosynthesis protein [Lachnospiraceae bacterium]
MKQYVVDAFTDELFHGNQAAVCVLNDWLPEELMKDITRENNFSETAFTVKENDSCVSRSFAPKLAVAEDPVCGSGHCHIIPYWADILGKEKLVACQASERGGTLYCRREGEKIFMAGKAALYSAGELYV